MQTDAADICFLSSMHLHDDKRVFYKQAISLVDAGYRVTHFCPGESEGDRVEQGVRTITFVPKRGILNRLLSIPRFVTRARRIKAKCYHCNEVDSWIAGVVVRLMGRGKLVVDIHEHYPSTFAESRFPPWLRPMVAGSVRFAFRVLSVATDRIVLAKRTVADDFRRVADKTVLVQNFAPLSDDPDAETANTGPTAENQGPLTLIHLGLVGRLRGWPQLLDALSQMADQTLRLHIVGTFNDGSEPDFRARVKELGLEDRVVVEGWMPYDQAMRRIEASDGGLVMFQPGIMNHVYALPHKMFDYMYARKPIVVPGFALEVADIVNESECGLLVESDKPASIAAAFDRLAADPELRRTMGEKGRQAVIDRYNWPAEERKLIDMYHELIGPPTGNESS